MKLTLRKANALQLLITEQIGLTTISTEAAVGRYDDPVALVTAAATKFTENLAKKVSLLQILYSIRKKVSVESQKAGIPDILADVAHIDKVSAILKPLAELTKFAPSEEVLKAALDDLKRESTAGSSYQTRNAFGTGVIPQGWETEWISNLSSFRKKKQNLSDKLLELNVRHEIELDDVEEGLLRKYDLI